MNPCHDPYTELEHYLQKAQEEIGRAVEELEQHEESTAWSDPESPVVPPPPAFQSHTLGGRSSSHRNRRLANERPHATLNRVCHDGNLLEVPNSQRQPKTGTVTSYFSKIGADVAPNQFQYTNGHSSRSYSPDTRRRMWQMHPSMSFPETTKEVLMLATSCKDRNDHKKNSAPTQNLPNGHGNGFFEPVNGNMRQRSLSESNPPIRFRYTKEDEEENIYPRPPSGDVNLLSIWADNLVLEIDKSLSGELNSAASISPSSDFSLSPAKRGDEICESNRSTPKQNENKESSISPRQSVAGVAAVSASYSKLVSPSPDSGIEHVSCETPEVVDGTVDDAACARRDNCWEGASEKRPELNGDSHLSDLEQVTPPPPQFEDSKPSLLSPAVLPLKRDRKTQVRSIQILKTANNVVETLDSGATPFETKDVGRAVARSIPATTVVPETMAAVTSMHIVNEAPSQKEVVGEQCLQSKDGKGSAMFEDNVQRNQFMHSRQFSSLRKAVPHAAEIRTTSLPKDAAKYSSEGLSSSQRSSSSSAVSSLSHLSMDKLAEFMRRMKTESEVPSETEAASISIHIVDMSNKDAETQTTPQPLSRSSSFTWVTDCDCSDWDSSNLRSSSEGSIQLHDCVNCKKNQTTNERLSPMPLSSDDDVFEDRGRSGAGSSSSLYLSACSGSSDSFDETCPTAEGEHSAADKAEENHHVRQSVLPQRGAALADITEEHVVSDTLSTKSSDSALFLAIYPSSMLNPSYSLSPSEPSASFPSTLKSPKRSQVPDQPIEPNILIINELNVKSISAPVLLRSKRHGSLPGSSSSESSPTSATKHIELLPILGPVPSRSHSAKELSELQAIEACSWLRAAGFPQYAQMYEDNQFPIDIYTVQRDHAFLEADAIQSLFRRLNTLNRCVRMKYVDNLAFKSLGVDESDEDEQCALSENWEFQRSSRRWSRIPSPSDEICENIPNQPQSSPKSPHLLHVSPVRKFLSPEEAYSSSHDSVFVDEQHSSPDSIRRSTLLRHAMTPAYQQIGDRSPGSSSGSGGALEELQERNLRRSGSDRVREGAKALLKRMESLKGKRKKKAPPAALSSAMQSDGSSSGSLTSSPLLLRTPRQDGSKHSQTSIRGKQKKKVWSSSCLGDSDVGALSDSECSSLAFPELWKDANSNDTKFVKHFVVPHGAIELATGQHLEPSSTYCKYIKPESQHQKKRSLLRSRDTSPIHKVEDDAKRGSYYDNITAPIVVFNDTCVEDLDKSDSNQDLGEAAKPSPSKHGHSFKQDDGEIVIINSQERRDSGVGSSLTRSVTYEQAPWHCFPQTRTVPLRRLHSPVAIMDLTSPQAMLVRKLSLLKLTTVMEKFSPTSRTGWSWAVPKFIRRHRTPDYKDKLVFGVPLVVVLQRTGRPLPQRIEEAIDFLKTCALDSTGLFRKSGVRSRIQRLKNLTEKGTGPMNLEEHQSYDVADMLKQYFRDLPEALLTNKLSETFISICQSKRKEVEESNLLNIPPELRFEAIQAVVMLMPDENREVLHTLLAFLRTVCGQASVNQMTATNLAVCFAPSLFHQSQPRSASSSPRRRKTVGAPDVRDLSENRAAYECLSCMLLNYDRLFYVSDDVMSQNRLTSVSHFEAGSLQDLSSIVCKGRGSWHDYVDSCFNVLVKEAKDRYRGWVNSAQTQAVDIAFKKLSDGHPLRLWKVSTEVEAPPIELLNRLLRERHVWDNDFQKGKVLCRLEKQSEIFQYLLLVPDPHPNCSHCILRSWKMDLPKGACALIEVSIEHPEAEDPPDSVRAIVLASRYLIEPCGSGKSRITHISRVDLRGRTPEWYHRVYGHTSAHLLVKLRNSFNHSITEGPETKV